MCYKYTGETKYQLARQKCKDAGAQLPVPRSDKERDDFFATLTALGRRTKINSLPSLILQLQHFEL